MTRKLSQPQAGRGSGVWSLIAEGAKPCVAVALARVLRDLFELGVEFVEEEGPDQLEDVPFGGVMGADLAAFAVVEDALEEGAEDGGGNAGPVEAAGGEEAVAHVAGEAGGLDGVLEEVAVDVGEGGEVFVEGGDALVGRGVEHFEEVVELGAEVGAVFAGAVFDEQVELGGFEDAGIVGEEAEEEPDEEPFQGRAPVVARFHGVVQFGHERGGLEVGRVFLAEAVGLLADEEGEMLDVAVQVVEGEFDHGVSLIFGFEVVEHHAGEIGHDHVAGDFVVPVHGGEFGDILEGLGLGLAEVLPGAFVFGEERARPEEVDAVIGVFQAFDFFLEGGQEPAFFAEDGEELVPEGLGLGAFIADMAPLPRELYGPLTDFVPG